MKVLGYIRVSTLTQTDNTSIAEQKKAIRQFCKLNKYDLVEIFEDSDSGRKANRDGFREMLDRLKANNMDGIVALRIDRLFRGVQPMAELFKLVEQKKKFIHTTDGVDTRQPVGNYLAKQLGLIGELESRHIAERLYSGRMAYFLQTGKTGKGNKNTTGYAPFGFDWQNGKLGQDKDKLELVKKAYKLYVDGWSIGTIARALSEISRTRNGNRFSKQGLRKTLKSRYYIGEIQYSGEVFKKHHRPIVSKATWNKAQKLLNTKGYQGKRTRIKQDGTLELPKL